MVHSSRILIAAVYMLMLAGCASQAEVLPQATGGLSNIRNQLMILKSEIQNTTAAAKDLVEHPRSDVVPQITRLTTQVATLEQAAGLTRQQAREVTAKADDHFAEWDAQLKTISGSLAQAGSERRKESMASFEKLRAQGRDTRASYSTYITNMKEASSYLQTDPTAAGVKAASKTLKNGMNSERQLLDNIDKMVELIDVASAGK